MSNEITKKTVGELALSEEILTDIDLESLNGDYLPLSGGIMNGNVLITNNDSCTVFSPQNSFLQAEVAYSGGTKTYGMSYCGSKGFCILGVKLSSDENNNQYIGIKLSGDISTIEDAVLSDIYCGKHISSYIENDDIYPKASKSIPNTHIGKDSLLSLSGLMWSIAVKSYSFSSFDSIKTIDTENNIVWFKRSLSELSTTYGKNAISLAKLSSLTETELIELFETDDNLFYVPGFPYIGNTTLNTLYSNTTLGGSSRAIGKYTFASGRDSIADMRYSHAEGTHCAALEIGSHAEGFKCKAKGQYSHVGGYGSSTLGNDAFAHGRSCQANKQQSIALGLKATANHDNSFVWSANEANSSVSNGNKTFNIYTGTGINDFYINGNNFISCIITAIEQMADQQKQQILDALGIANARKYKLTVNAVAEDGETPIEGVCEFSEILPEYDYGSVIDVTVTPNIIYTGGEERYEFIGWVDEENNNVPLMAAGSEAEIKRTVEMNKDINLKAKFNVIAKPNILEYLYDQINNLSADTSGKVYYQTKDIDLTEDNKVWTGIGTSRDNAFKGTYVGGGHAVNVKFAAKRDANGEIIPDSTVGVFSYINGAVIRDLNVYINGNDSTGPNIKWCGGIAGECEASSTTANRFINITVNGNIGNVLEGGVGDDPVQQAGGIVGKISSVSITTKTSTIFINCKNYADIYATAKEADITKQKIGGIVGYASTYVDGYRVACAFTDCENHGEIWTGASEANLTNTESGIGGFIGYCGAETTTNNNDGAMVNISNCKSTGGIHLRDEIFGGDKSNLLAPNLCIGSMGGRLRNMTSINGTNYFRSDIRFCKSCPSWLNDKNKLDRNVLGYYDENDENCIKDNLVKIISSTACVDTNNVYKRIIPSQNIFLPSKTSSIILDESMFSGNVVLKSSTATKAIGTVINDAEPNIKKYTFS